MAAQAGSRRRFGRLGTPIAIAMASVLAGATVVEAALISGSLPTSGLTYVSSSINSVNMAGDAVRLKIKGELAVKTTYAIVAPSEAFVGGWHFHNGPVIVTVTAGTLTFYGADCGTWDVTAGHTYIESAGEILNAKVLTSRNSGNAEWFTTRLYPVGASDPVPVDAPCTP
jgi:hypothetical protein